MAALDFPDNPATGDLYGSSGTVWRWDGARWASTAGAAGARGVVAFQEILGSVAGIAGGAWAQTGVNVTFNAVAGRRYQITYTGALDSNHGAAIPAYLGVYNAGTNTQMHATGGDLTANPADGSTRYWNGVFSTNALSGTVTLRLMCYFGAGTGNVFSAAAGVPAQLLVEDITYEAGTSGVLGPNDMSRGLAGRPAIVTADQGGFTGSNAAMSGFNIGVNIVSGRMYELSWLVSTKQDATGGYQTILASLDGANLVIVQAWCPATAQATYGGVLNFVGGPSVYGMPNILEGAGKIINLLGRTSTGTMTIGSGSLNNGRLACKDVGPIPP